MDTMTSTATKTVSGTKLFIATMAMFGAGAIALATVPFTTQPVIKISYPTGCYLQVGEKINILTQIPTDKAFCESIFVAREYNGRKDFLRLLKSFTSQTLLEQDILDNTKTIKVYYITLNSSGNVFDYFTNTTKLFKSNKCETVTYFGIQLYCFNEVVGVVNRKNNLRPIIPMFTVLKYTSKTVSNQLLGKSINPYSWIRENSIKYYDASKPEFYGETLETAKCTSDKGGANYQASFNRVYVCSSLLIEDKILGSAVLYHEANHKFQTTHSWAHQEDVDKIVDDNGGFDNIVINSNCEKIDYYISRRRDWDFKSVYGAHIEYLLSMAKNNLLDCSERQKVWDTAESLLKTKLCQKPNVPNIVDVRPVCN